MRRGGLAGLYGTMGAVGVALYRPMAGKHTQWTDEAWSLRVPWHPPQAFRRAAHAAKVAELSDKIMPQIEGFRVLSIEFEATEQPA